MADISNLPFHRKYRPNTLAKYIGNTKIKETAMKSLSSGKLPQVILLYGASGCGKTSFARLFAKEYNCEDRDAEHGACGVCQSCEMFDEYIASGEFGVLPNMHEVNIGDQSGKYDLDAILEDMMIPVYGNEWKVYILDECHEASPALQNKLLKIVEEPPEHVLIMFCTTEPEKLLETLKNRCQLKLGINKPTLKELSGLLQYICSTEGVEYDKNGLNFIASRDDLTIRSALQNLQQVVNEQNSAKYEDVIKVFDVISGTLIRDTFKAMKNKDVLRYVTILYEARSRYSLKEFFGEMRNFVVRGIYTINGIVMDNITDSELKLYRDIFGDIGVQRLSSFLARILNINMGNLELELLMLGYTGFDTPQQAVGGTAYIQPLEGEVAKEIQIANELIKEKDEMTYAQGVVNAEKQMQSVNFDDLLAMGGLLVTP